MKSKDDSMRWIPLWVDKWLFGSTRLELQPDERSVFIDLLVLASKDSGFIRANPQTEYPLSQLAGLLCVSEDLLKRSIEKFIEVGKLRRSENGVGFYIVNWAEYQLSERHRRRFVESQIQMSAKKDAMSEELDSMSAKAVTIGEKKEKINKLKIKDLTDSLSKEKDLNSKINLSERKAFLRAQMKELGVDPDKTR